MGFLKSFFAVDNSVNEQTVNGAFWGAVAVVGWVVKAFGVESISNEMLYMALSASLSSFMISGFKKV